MMKLTNLNRITITRVVLLLILFLSSSIYSQTVVSTRINRLWGQVVDQGGNKGATYTANDLNLFADYGAYGCRFQGGESFFSGFIGIGMDNYNGGTAMFILQDKYQSTGNVTTALKAYARYANPTYTVISGGKSTTPPANAMGTVTYDGTKCIGTSDLTVTVSNQYYCKVQMDRKILAWTQDNHNNYTIIDLTFTNKSTTTWTNFYVYLHDGEYQFQRADGTNPNISSASIDQYYNANTPRRWYHYYGSRTSDSLRIFYNYSCDDPEKQGDNMGQPLTQIGGGRLLDYEYTFVGTLHASKQPYTPSGVIVNNIDQNDADDMNQPMVTTYANLQNNLNLPSFSTVSNYDPQSSIAKQYYQLMNGTLLSSTLDMTGANVRPGHHRKNQDELNEIAPGGETAISAQSNSFESMIRSFGPYTFAPNQQIRIVLVVGIAGMSRAQAIAVGQAWYKDTKNGTSTLTDPPNLPDATYGYFPSVAKGATNSYIFPTGATATDLKKDRWVSTAIDSVNKTVSRAKYNFRTGYNAPVTPPPPTTFTVTGAGTGIKLSWTDVAAEQMSNFAGYRIMRKVGITDTTYYQQVYNSNNQDISASHIWTDASARPGVQYYYYIQALATISSTNQNAYPTERGKTIGSGRVFFYNNTAVSPEAPTNLSGDLSKIAMVPNPFNYNDQYLRGYGFSNPTNLNITFYELPQTVTIRIFTENGDLVKTIQHNTDSGKDSWNMINESQQTVASGVYIVVFQTPDGSMAYQKLVVVR